MALSRSASSFSVGTLSPNCFLHRAPASCCVEYEWVYVRDVSERVDVRGIHVRLNTHTRGYTNSTHLGVHQVPVRLGPLLLCVCDDGRLGAEPLARPFAAVHARPDGVPPTLARIQLAVAVVSRHLKRRRCVSRRERGECVRFGSGRGPTQIFSVVDRRRGRGRGRTVALPRVVEGVAARLRLGLVWRYRRHRTRSNPTVIYSPALRRLE